MGSDDSETEKRDRVLSPDDLDITEQPEVEEIDDGRYVVSPDGPAQKPDRDLLENPDWLNSADEDDDTAPHPTEQPPQREQSPKGDRSPTTQSTQNTSPGTNRDQQPPANGGQQQPGTNQSVTGGQQPPTGGGQRQPGNSGQQSPAANQSTNRNQQQPATNQSTNRGQQPQSGNQQPAANRGQQPQSNNQQPAANQSTNRSQQPPANGGQQQPAANQSTAGSSQPSRSDIAAHDQPPVEPPAVELTNENVSKFLAKELTQGGDSYGFDATLNVEGEVNRGRMTSDDIGKTLETLLRWYARQTTDEVDPESVLGIILAGSDLAVEYPVQSVYSVVKRHDLKPDDSISDLLAAVRKEGSFTVPPSEE